MPAGRFDLPQLIWGGVPELPNRSFLFGGGEPAGGDEGGGAPIFRRVPASKLSLEIFERVSSRLVDPRGVGGFHEIF